jgi:hypothetical protein
MQPATDLTQDRSRPALLWATGTADKFASPELQRSENQVKLANAIRTVLECIGEDPEREGLLKTPERYAKALLWMTKGYDETLTGESLLPRSFLADESSCDLQMPLAMLFSPKTTTRWSSSATSTFTPSASTTSSPSLARCGAPVPLP